MKQLKFLINVSCDGKPVWYKNCCYEVVSEGISQQGRTTYKLFCEDLQLRGIDACLKDKFFTVIEVPVVEEKVKQISQKTSSKRKNNKKNKS